MSLAIIHSRAQVGVHAPAVTVEVHLSAGLPKFSVVGLAETAVKESKDRVRSALLNMHFDFPSGRITVNLAPADIPKEGTHFDLPIALGILAASDQIPKQDLHHYEFAGELALSGKLRAMKGVLPFALATKNANRPLIIPFENRAEAALIHDLTLYPVKHLMEICAHLRRERLLIPYDEEDEPVNFNPLPDLLDVRGQQHAKRALEIAASGGHSILFSGPPGTGKTMLASRLPSILPPMTEEEALESAAILSISHQGFHRKRWKNRVFRSPHHSASGVALVGGGNPPKPGEISLAHRGVLFLDELPEFSRHVLEALREPLESGKITISRAARQCEFPADFQLIAAMNPCPCGHLGDKKTTCRCTPRQIHQYQTKISGPFLDRIDLYVDVPKLPPQILLEQNDINSEDSDTVRERVVKAVNLQLQRAQKLNAKLSNSEIIQTCSLGDAEQKLLMNAIKQLKLSARSYHRILKVARTIADLNESKNIQRQHLAEAIGFRRIY